MTPCVICGARCTDFGTVCDEICLAAKKNGRTRGEELAFQASDETLHTNDTACTACGVNTWHPSGLCEECRKVYA